MFDKTSTGWQLSKQSWQVLKLDKELILFPLFSGIACLLVSASFAAPVILMGEVEAVDSTSTGNSNNATATKNFDANGELISEEVAAGDILALAGVLAYYVANYFVIVFFNSALIACAIIRFKGGNPTLGDGFSAAFSRLPQIFCWALVAGTVGMLLRILQSNTESRLNRFLVGLLGLAWSTATYFVVPVIVVEKLGPLAAGKRSLEILRSTWGQSLSANFGVGCIIALLMMLSLVPVIVGVVLWGLGIPYVGIPILIGGIVMLLVVALVSSALDSVVLAALYLYAAEGQIPDQFQDDIFQTAFQTT